MTDREWRLRFGTENERGNLMSNRNYFAPILMACSVVIGFLGVAPGADAVSAGTAFLNPDESPGDSVIQINEGGRGSPIYAPIAPSYQYYDYPYYYSRGYYPTHIGRGFVYFGYPYAYYQRRYHSRYGGRCSYGHRRCVAGWVHNRGSGSSRRRQHFGACRCR